MAQSYFIWNGVDCRSMGVRLQGAVPVIRPEERVEHVTIPGRAGDLTLLEGDDIYQSYIQTATIMVHGASRIREIQNWLRGTGYVTFHGEPDRRQKARVIGAVTMERQSYNLDWWVGEVQFYCEPFKRQMSELIQTVERNGSIYNGGDIAERPLMVVTTSAATVNIACGGGNLSIGGSDTVIASGMQLYVDCDTRIVWHIDHDTGDIVVDTQLSVGTFPSIPVGTSTITGSGWSRMRVDRRERFL